MSVTNTLKQRKKTHGEFTETAVIIQALKGVMRQSKNWDTLTPAQKEALEMNQHKIGRILCGNPNHKDSWYDIQGYAKLGEDSIND